MMNQADEAAFRAALQDRTIHYAGYALTRDFVVRISADRRYIETAAGRFAAEILVSLLARMDVTVDLDPELKPLVAELQVIGREANPYFPISVVATSRATAHVHLGSKAPLGALAVYGTGWNAYCGSPAAVHGEPDDNILGSALSVIFAAAHLFYERGVNPTRQMMLNCLTWQPTAVEARAPSFSRLPRSPHLWIVGAGSVGTAVAFFLSRCTTRFSATVVDQDVLKVENIARSPVFNMRDLGVNKAEILGNFLRARGVRVDRVIPHWLNQEWQNRAAGSVDLVVSAANEHNVRSVIESAMPPVQIYATTGANNQVVALRHRPGEDPCSLCVFPEEPTAIMKCSTGEVVSPAGERKDAALPFLSYLAGVMAAADILKLGEGKPSGNRTVVTLNPQFATVHAPLAYREDCGCSYNRQSRPNPDSPWPMPSNEEEKPVEPTY